jgi:hypothetical protein
VANREELALAVRGAEGDAVMQREQLEAATKELLEGHLTLIEVCKKRNIPAEELQQFIDEIIKKRNQAQAQARETVRKQIAEEIGLIYHKHGLVAVEVMIEFLGGLGLKVPS